MLVTCAAFGFDHVAMAEELQPRLPASPASGHPRHTRPAW
jgi:hypothetical protein